MPTVTFSAAGSFTWTSPAWATALTVECWGGGAGGGDRGGGQPSGLGGAGLVRITYHDQSEGGIGLGRRRDMRR